MKPTLLIVIPAYNEAKVIGDVLAQLPRQLPGIDRIQALVVDDGSTDQTAQIVRKLGFAIAQHPINRGLGGALGTGFAYARDIDADILVTFDADGQHAAADISRLIAPIAQNKVDVVIGSRLLQYAHQMPPSRKFINRVSNMITYILFGIWTSDSQSGLRAFSKRAVQQIAIYSQRMEVSSEIFREIKKNNLAVHEIAIEPIYTQYSLSKGQQLHNSFNIVTKLLIQRLKSTLSF